jgi:hypothetical protein
MIFRLSIKRLERNEILFISDNLLQEVFKILLEHRNRGLQRLAGLCNNHRVVDSLIVESTPYSHTFEEAGDSQLALSSQDDPILTR